MFGAFLVGWREIVNEGIIVKTFLPGVGQVQMLQFMMML